MSTQETVRRQVGSIEKNALRIDPEKAEQLVDALNTDLAATYVLYHRIKKHHWNVEGAEFLELHEYLGEIAYDLEAFGVIIETMRDHIELADDLGDYTTEELLRETLETVEEHAHHLEHYLEDDTLVLESATN